MWNKWNVIFNKFMHSSFGEGKGYLGMVGTGKGVRRKHIYLVPLKSRHAVNYLPLMSITYQ